MPACTSCGAMCREGFAECLTCARAKAKAEDRLCDCGKFKKPGFKNCYPCSQAGKQSKDLKV